MADTKFKRIGDLKNIGIAFVSLYTDETNRMLYIACRTGQTANSHPVFLITQITVDAVRDFIGKKHSLRKTMRMGCSLYLRQYADSGWQMEPVEKKELTKWLPKDCRFVSRYCEDKPIINYYLDRHFDS